MNARSPASTKLNNMIHEIAASLRRTIENTPEDPNVDPEEAYVDLACRFVIDASEKVSIAARGAQNDAAFRTFEILSKWMLAHPGAQMITKINEATGKFELIISSQEPIVSGKSVIAFSQGISIQDAYAQAAQVISLEEETP